MKEYHAFNFKTLIMIGLPYLIAFFSPLWALFLGVGILTIGDTFTGIWAAKKAGRKITSRALSRTVTKMILYFLTIILARVMESIFIDWIPIVNITAGYLAIVEFKSNMENIGYITDIDVWNYLKDRIDAFKPKETKEEERENISE